MLTRFSRILNWFNEYIDARYAYQTGDIVPDEPSGAVRFRNSYFFRTLVNADDLNVFIVAIQEFFCVLSDLEEIELIDNLYINLNSTIDDSPLIHLEVIKQDNHVTIFPAGAKLLDERVVKDTLVWLEKHPKVADHFQNALTIYLEKDKSKFRNLLDDLRFSIEGLLQELLSNEKNLDNQVADIGGWMKKRGSHKQVRNMFERLLNLYNQYQNDAVKHAEEWVDVDVEYIIYQTGIFMRLLLVLERDSLP